jgi:hydrogenase maturation protease
VPPSTRRTPAGMDVAFAMKGVRRVIVVDASRIGVEPGTIHKVPGEELTDLTPPEGNLHRFKWDQALGFAMWLLKDEYPQDVTVWLVEGESFDLGDVLSPAVQASVERIADAIVADVSIDRREEDAGAE